MVAQIIPVLAAGFLPQNFDYVVRDDVSAVVFSTFTMVLHSSLVLGFLTAFLSISMCAVRHRAWIGVLYVGLVVIEFVERRNFALAARSHSVYLPLLIVIAVLITIVVLRRKRLRIGPVPLKDLCLAGGVALCWAILQLMGYHDPSLYTIVADRYGDQLYDAHDYRGALTQFSTAARSSPQTPLSLILVGDTETQLDEYAKAAAAYETALRLRGWPSWTERFSAMRKAATEHIESGTASDYRRADELFRIILKMRRANSRLPRNEVALALAAYAYLIAKDKRSTQYPLSLYLLAEANSTDPTLHIAEQLMREPELNVLALQGGDRGVSAESAKLFPQNLEFSEDLFSFTKANWPVDDQLGFGRGLVWSSILRHPGGPGPNSN